MPFINALPKGILVHKRSDWTRKAHSTVGHEPDVTLPGSSIGLFFSPLSMCDDRWMRSSPFSVFALEAGGRGLPTAAIIDRANAGRQPLGGIYIIIVSSSQLVPLRQSFALLFWKHHPSQAASLHSTAGKNISCRSVFALNPTHSVHGLPGLSLWLTLAHFSHVSSWSHKATETPSDQGKIHLWSIATCLTLAGPVLSLHTAGTLANTLDSVHIVKHKSNAGGKLWERWQSIIVTQCEYYLSTANCING